jgi:hypothetical protein
MLIYIYKQIRNWMYNKSRGSSSGTGTRGVLNLKNTSRLLHPWQAFSKMYAEELKSKLNDEWQAYKQANPDAGHTGQDHFNFRNRMMQEWYEASSAEVQEKVEEFRQQHKEGLADEEDKGDNTNRLLQK